MRTRIEGMRWGCIIESPDPLALATFYSRLLEWPIHHQEPDTAIPSAPGGPVFIVLQKALDYQAPVWPPIEGGQRPMMHLDFQVGDLDVACAEALALGTTIAGYQPREHLRVMFDPFGHPYCLCQEID